MNDLVKQLELIGTSASYRFDRAQMMVLLESVISRDLVHAVMGGGAVKPLEVAINSRSDLVCGLQPAEVPDEEKPQKDDEDDDQQESDNEATSSGLKNVA
ncbi:hypothetical protein Q3O59_05820 [Alkalimonas delamerensis]|uniref:Uncharacterized protein n=1 Tax=Alkalimonas delamerensis TaxID=265981 RepID=A0ABT9GNJ2_9GAMM|nr:hypothetical protein [Alkalimonas delamerensis]MDP4528547.1 hypothetical protein [Alkalimonas delamerensis]